MSTETKDKDVPSLDAVKAVASLREAELRSIANDARPRQRDVKSDLLAGKMFYSRWTPEMNYAIRERLQGIDHKSNRITATDENRGHCIKVIQIGLWRNGERHLAFPGDDGFNELGRLPNAELSRLASEALEFNEVFSG